MSGIIDGRRWLEERLRQLQAALDANPTADERVAIESEMAKLREEAGSHRRRFRRWLLWGGRLPNS